MNLHQMVKVQQILSNHFASNSNKLSIMQRKIGITFVITA